MALTFSACGGAVEESKAGGESSNAESQAQESSKQESSGQESSGQESSELESSEPKKTGKELLDGKKVIFIGDSFVYYGQTVLEKSQSKLEFSTRANDKGFFYRICKANGAEVNVVNWTFGGHSLKSIMIADSCPGSSYDCYGKDHKSYLTDRVYDYVVLSPTRGVSEDQAIQEIEAIKTFFTAANPNVKFVILVSSGVHGISDNKTVNTGILSNLAKYEKEGFTIVDWGGMLRGILEGSLKIEGSTFTYEKNSFIIRKSSSDGHHPNQLSGYITSLMLYCAITGESAVGQTYAFCNDSSLNSNFSFSKFISKYYTSGATTNYDAVFASASEMKGIQTLIDSFLEGKSYQNYTK